MAEQLALIDKDLLLRLLNRDAPQPPANPFLREMGRAENELDAELSKKPSSLQPKKVANIIAKRSFHKANYEGTPQLPAILNKTLPQSEEKSDPWTARILSAMPDKYQRASKALLDHITNSGRLQWGADGQIIQNGNVIKGSNIFDLVHSLTRLRPSQQPPHGAAEFLEALQSINVPQELIVNATNIKKKLKTGKAISRRRKQTPPAEQFSDSDASEATPIPVRRKKKTRARSPDIDLTPFSTPQSIPTTAKKLSVKKWQRLKDKLDEQ